MTEVPSAILWLDPGLGTGWAALFNAGTPDEHFEAGQVQGRVEAGDKVEEVLSYHGRNLHVGWEAYLIGGGGRITGDPVPSLEVIGMTRWLCHKYGATTLLPVPSESRLVATPAVLERLGWRTRGVHAVAATQHLAAYCVRQKFLWDRIGEVYDEMLKRYNGLKTEETRRDSIMTDREDDADG